MSYNIISGEFRFLDVTIKVQSEIRRNRKKLAESKTVNHDSRSLMNKTAGSIEKIC